MKKRWKSYLIFGTPIVLIVIYLLYSVWFDSWRTGGYIKPSLDSEYIPTAEYLLQNPIPTPDSIRVSPPPSSNIRTEEQITVSIPFKPKSPLGSLNEMVLWTQIFVNAQRISGNDWNVAIVDSVFADGYTAHFSFSPTLNPGLHILEIRVGKSVTALLNPAEAYTYTWAYRVE